MTGTVDPAAALARRLVTDPGGPLLTFYDDADGTRVELSAVTFANAVAKTAGLLVDGLGLDAGEPVGVALPTHWQTAVVLAACWSAGCPPRLGAIDGAAAFVARDGIGDATADEVVAVALTPFGGRVPGGVPAGVTDLGEAATYADVFRPRSPLQLPAGPDCPGGARVLSTLGLDSADGVWWGLLGPLVAGGSVVLVAHADPATLAARCSVEKVSHTAGVRVDGYPAASAAGSTGQG